MFLTKLARSRVWLACVATLFLLLAGYLVGAVSLERGLPPSRLLAGWASELIDRYLGRSRDVPGDTIETAHLSLSLTRIQLPVSSDSDGGGIASYRDGLLVMTGPGKLFWVKDGSLSLLDVVLPPLNLDAYQEAAKSPEYSGLWHDFSKLRYLDLLAVHISGRDLLFVTFTEWNPKEKCYAFVLARLDLSGFGPDPREWNITSDRWRVLFRANPCLELKSENIALEGHISGGRMLFDKHAQELVFSIGDYRNDGVYAARRLAQEDDSDYGKILRSNVDGEWFRRIAKGTRNPQGLVLTDRNELWETEHGPMGGDELNLIKEGGNYGWPLVTLGNRYSGLPWPSVGVTGRDHLAAGLTPAVFAWVPSVGISAIIQVEGFDPAWDGDLLAGSLKGQSLYRLRIVDQRVQTVETVNVGQRLRELVQLSDGRIALWTDLSQIVFLRPSESGPAVREMKSDLEKFPWNEERKQAVRAAIQSCLECHSLAPGVNAGAPSLSDVVGREVASTSYQGYSSALRQVGGRWSPDRLASYIRDPQRFVPGTSMPGMQMTEGAARDLVSLLEELYSAE